LESAVLAVLKQGRQVGSAQAGEAVEVVTAQTPFYAEAGGQTSDIGWLTGLDGGSWEVDVEEVSEAIEGLVVHRGRVARGALHEGDGVLLRVDGERRLDIARNHTATHLLQASLRQVLGEQIRQAGSLVAPERLRFDFSHGIALSPQELVQVEREVNCIVMADLPVQTGFTAYRDALAQGAIALFGEKYGEEVRLVQIEDGEETISQELCGGTHVVSTGQIGLFKILSERSIGAGLRRIEAVTGWGTYQTLSESLAHLETLAGTLSVPQQELEARLAELIHQSGEQSRQIAQLRRQLAVGLAKGWTDLVVAVDGIQVLAMEVEEVGSMTALREFGDEIRERMETGVIVLGAVMDERPGLVAMVTPDLVGRGIRADELVRRVAQVVGGGGGGRPTVAQAGGRDPGKLSEALGMVEGLVADMLGGAG
jgi:alanyl-tRNA synthetase